MLTALLLNLQQ